MTPTQHKKDRIDARLSGLVDFAQGIISQAEATGGPVLVCWAFPLTRDSLATPDLLGTMNRTTPGQFRFYWEQPSQAFALAAGGEAVSHQGGGAERFKEAGAWVERLYESAMTGASDGRSNDGRSNDGRSNDGRSNDGRSNDGRSNDGRSNDGGSNPGPYLVGGFSFFDALDEASWRGFDPARLVAPVWLAIREGETQRGMVQFQAHPGEQPEHLLARAADGLARLDECFQGRPAQDTTDNRAFRVQERRDGRDNWIKIVRHARDRVRAGDLTKVVLARALDLDCDTPPCPVVLLERLRSAYPECYNFMVDPGQGEIFLGSSPERMFRFANGTVELAALAGTVPRGATPEADAMQARQLMDSRKEREEHQIVVDGIVAATSSLGSVRYPEKPSVLKFSNLQHLHTPITLQLEHAVSPFTLLGQIHPTAAVGGHPQAEAFRLIRECEQFDRGWYAAPLGWLNRRGEGEFAVALRSGTLSGRRMQLFAGGGIVAQSDPDREYEETQIKFQPLLSALGSE